MLKVMMNLKRRMILKIWVIMHWTVLIQMMIMVELISSTLTDIVKSGCPCSPYNILYLHNPNVPVDLSKIEK